jgi:hypothetical protein
LSHLWPTGSSGQPPSITARYFSAYLHSVYPKVHISLHAGELAPGLVPPDGLSFHIREAVHLGHAERIGHGVDVMYERDPNALLKGSGVWSSAISRAARMGPIDGI